MIKRENTITVGDLLKMLADGRVTADMPIAVYQKMPSCLVGQVATEILTFDDGSKLLTFYTGEPCAALGDIDTAAEVFP